MEARRPRLADAAVTARLDLAIVGTPKAATSSLYAWLDAHPSIQGSQPKETYYFSDRDDAFARPAANFNDHGWDGLEQFFTEPRNGRRRFEATAINLYQETARRAFASLEPQPLVVVTLRCPAEQIRSAFYFHQHAGRIESWLTFSDYARALLHDEFERVSAAIGYADVRASLGPSLSMNRYALWLDRWGERFTERPVMVVTLQRIDAEPRDALADICRRIGVDETFYDEFAFQPVNVTSARPLGRQGRIVETREAPPARKCAEGARGPAL